MKYFVIGIIAIQILFSTFIVHTSYSQAHCQTPLLKVIKLDSNSFDVHINGDVYEELNSIQLNNLLKRIGNDSISPNIR
jgi:hypothetical protein